MSSCILGTGRDVALRQHLTGDLRLPVKDARKEVLPSKVGVDATRKHKFPARSIPPQEDTDRSDRQWAGCRLE